jgi:hypothetical protein
MHEQQHGQQSSNKSDSQTWLWCLQQQPIKNLLPPFNSCCLLLPNIFIIQDLKETADATERRNVYNRRRCYLQ